jgi:hypothetical protein
MSCFLFADDDETTGKINIDQLYDKHQKRDLKQLTIFNKILNRIHKRITTTTRTNKTDKFVWFTVPEYIFGEPIYKQGDCIGYLVVKLEENGFQVKYVHPNTLFVSWENWVPSYVRNEIKKKTGYIIDEKGNVIGNKNDENVEESNDPNNQLFNDRSEPIEKPVKQYTSIHDYKPTGKLVYNNEMFANIEKKLEK